MILTPAEQARMEELDAMIKASKRHIAPVKEERRKILLRAYQRDGRSAPTLRNDAWRKRQKEERT